MEAYLLSAWNVLLQQLAITFTDPTARTWQQIAWGWVLHRGPATVTGMYRTLGEMADRHWTVYEKFFYRAAWKLDALSHYLMVRVVGPLILESGMMDSSSGEAVVDLHLDDTTVGRYGKHVAHAGWYKDASATGPSTKGVLIHWAHNWIVGVVSLRLRGWGLMRWTLPVVFALYRKADDCDADHPFATRQVLAARLVHEASKSLQNMRIRVAADGQYATRDMVAGLPEHVSLVSRMRHDAAIYALCPAHRPRSRRGPKPRKGPRLPTPAQIATRSKKGWTSITLLRQGRTIQRHILGVTCIWYHVARLKPVRLLIVRDPAGKQKDDYLFCTDANTPDPQIAQRYHDRWGIEESILEAKQHLGFESARGWCSKTVHHQAPLAMILLTLVKVWYARCAVNHPSLRPQAMPWYTHKTQPSFLDMLAALRTVLWKHRITPNSLSRAQIHAILKTLCYPLTAAA